MEKIINSQNEPRLYTTLEREAHAEMTEKKSVFIGHAAPVKSEEEALDFIGKIKRAYGDASHNVYAYITNGGVSARYSDDGEPQGTAGIPVLEVIKKNGFCDAVIVVTRYFGGILLGAGGLVRAYSAAAKLAAAEAHIVTYENYKIFMISVQYTEYGKVQYELPKYKIIADNIEFCDTVTMTLAVKAVKYDEFISAVSELSAGKIIPKIIGERYDCR